MAGAKYQGYEPLNGPFHVVVPYGAPGRLTNRVSERWKRFLDQSVEAEADHSQRWTVDACCRDHEVHRTYLAIIHALLQQVAHAHERLRRTDWFLVGQDKLVTVDVNPGSPDYGKVVHTLSVGGRNEAHHSGFTDDRRYLWAAGLDTS